MDRSLFSYHTHAKIHSSNNLLMMYSSLLNGCVSNSFEDAVVLQVAVDLVENWLGSYDLGSRRNLVVRFAGF